MRDTKVLALGENRGAPRLWMQGRCLQRAGFVPGAPIRIDGGDRHLVLSLVEPSELTPNAVSRKVRKTADGREVVDPVIDLNSRALLGRFDGIEALRVALSEGQIIITPLESELRAQTRGKRLADRLAGNQPLEVGSLAFGAGLLDSVLHQAFEEQDMPTHLAFANEVREDLIEHAAQHHPAVAADTKLLCMPMQELAFDERVLRHVPPVDILVAGLPCSGASVAGRAKRHLPQPEDHPLVGHLVAAAVAVIARVNPALIVIENVPSYASSASAAILRNQLRDFGYGVHERRFLATEFGDLEQRERWCMVAATRGLQINLDDVQPAPFVARTLADVLEPAEAVADRWSPMNGLKAKQSRDLEAGKNFKMQIYAGTEASIGTLTKGLSKNRSTDPKFRHPQQPELLRVPTVREHGRIKGFPERTITAIEALGFTSGHEALGQAVCAGPFTALFRYLARSLRVAGQALPSVSQRPSSGRTDGARTGLVLAAA